MTRFYCLRCKKETETASEVQDMTTSGRYRLHGWVIKKKSKEGKEDAVAKKKAAAFNRQCKELGLEIFQSDKACQQCVAKCLDDRVKRDTVGKKAKKRKVD
ncbi:unnamed protein product [Rhizophagus irregularis]|nr:unnamed protein product [Rhizophagus irregularis]